MDEQAPSRSAEGPGKALRTLYWTLPSRRRHAVWLTAVLLLIGGLAEVASVSSIVPFLAVLTDPTRLAAIPVMGNLISHLPPGSDLITITAAAFLSMFVLSGLLRLLLAKLSQSLSFNVAKDLSVIGFAKLIRQPYTYYLARHSGEALSQFEKLQNINGAILAGVQALIASVIALLLLILLFVINPVVSLISAGVLIGTYLLISVAVRPTLGRNSIIGSIHTELRVKRVQEVLGGIRDILLDRSQPAFEREFAHSADRICHVSSFHAFIGQAPRIVVEMLGMVLIGAYAWYLARQPGGVTAAIPTLGAMALGAQRLLPLLQQSYNGWSGFLGSRQQIVDIVDLLSLEARMPLESLGELRVFDRLIRFSDVGYSYPSGGPVLRDVNFVIAKGERIGIAGTTGSGKSTLMDLLLGLLQPSFGSILIDDIPLDDHLRARWQSKIAHVPQTIYLTDDSIAANIAFGVPDKEVDHVRVEHAARSAGIASFIDTLADGYEARTGERGVRLSGGQRQRLGIARALYKRANVLIFDEATSALDTRTEEGVMASVAALGPDITIVLIAHRLTTLKDCDRVIHLEAGRIHKIVERGKSAASDAARPKTFSSF